MKTLITDIIKEINKGTDALTINTMFIQHCTDYNKTTLEQVITTKTEVIKRFYHYRAELDTAYAGLDFQADAKSRDGVITPRSVKALQATVEGNTTWEATIISNTKDVDGLDIPYLFTATEMLEFADAVTLDVEGYYFQQKTHCNNLIVLTDVQLVLDYDFS